MKIPAHEARVIFNKLIPQSSLHNSGKLLMQGNCPLCTDTKRRFYMKDYGNETIMVYCHNCGYSKSLYVFLKEFYPTELVYLKDSFLKSIKDGSAFNRKVEKAKKNIIPFNETDVKLRLYIRNNAISVLSPQEDKKIEKFRLKTLSYFGKRRISNKIINDLSCFYKGPLKGYAGIPFYDETGSNLIHIQGRRIFKVKSKNEENIYPKYKFLRDVENGIEIENKPLWGMWLVDKDMDVIIVEGTLDAGAFTNGVATCGATLSDSFISDIKRKYKKRIWCPDNYWVDKSGKELTQRLLLLGESCLVFPKDCTYKDPNNMIVEMGIDKIPIDFIYQNIYKGKFGLTKLKLMESENVNDIINSVKGDINERQMENTRGNRKRIS